MDSAVTGTSKRLLRVLVASGMLALGWVAVDMIAHSEPAAAAETIDLLPVGDDALDSVTTLVDSVVSGVVSPVATPVIDTIVTPIVTPVIDTVVAPIGDAVAPVLEPVVEPLTPILTPILTVVLEPVAPILEVLPAVETATDAVGAVATLTPNGTILATGGALLVGVALIAVVVPLLPVPTNGGPLRVPLAPAAPTGSIGSYFVAIYGELNSGFLAGFGAFGTPVGSGDRLPLSPTFASDTTPD